MDAAAHNRIDTLEAHIAQQHLMLEELSAVMVRQQGEIDRLNRQMTLYLDRIQSLEAQAPVPDNVPPPHY